jgi:protease II
MNDVSSSPFILSKNSLDYAYQLEKFENDWYIRKNSDSKKSELVTKSQFITPDYLHRRSGFRQLLTKPGFDSRWNS